MSRERSGGSQPWLLLGGKRQRALCAVLRAAIEQWTAQWFAKPPPVSVSVYPSAEVSSGPGGRIAGSFGVRSADGDWQLSLVVSHSVAALAAHAPALEAASSPADDTVAGAFEEDMIAALWTAVRPNRLAQARLERVSPDALETVRASLGKRHVTLVCRLGDAPGAAIHLGLSASLVSWLLPEERAASPAQQLFSRRAALGAVAVPIECEVGAIQIPVRDLHALKLGDVLVTQQPLEGRAKLRVRGKQEVIAEGTLGESGGFKAIRIETTNQGFNR